jgi:hypothetical protein
MLVIHIINGKVYLVDYAKEHNMKEVSLDEALEIMIQAVS